ncbi:MAG: flagellar hook-associated protein FlgK [Micrococcaceae bacterium]|nr:flagellar hook-associated protein FlgK [Micrococcaceae bacterium]
MSTFGALNTAFSGLTAARKGLEIVGQNIANAGTTGYTRQRMDVSAVGSVTSGMFTTGARPGEGVSVDGVSRLGDVFADSRVRSTAAAAGYTDIRSTVLSAIEDGTQEPGENGISAKLQDFWAGWSGMASQAGEAAPAAVLLQAADALGQQLSAGYSALDSQWSQVRGQATGMVDGLNAAASQLAALNVQIRSTQNAGASANELVDQRNQLATTVASLAGGTVRDAGDGTVDVLLGGNALVTGGTARAVQLAGASRMSQAAGVQLEWTNRPGTAIALDSGRIAGALSVLAPADGGSGGTIAEAAGSYNAFATELAQKVNTIHAKGVTPGGATNQAFFDLSAGVPAAQGLTVLPGSASELATGSGAGTLDGSNADALAQLGTGAGSPGASWGSFISALGSASQSARQQGQLADAAAISATGLQASGGSVDLDEENLNMLSYQHAYQAAARVMTAVDEMLDVLINKTGLVGR